MDGNWNPEARAGDWPRPRAAFELLDMACRTKVWDVLLTVMQRRRRKKGCDEQKVVNAKKK